MNLAKRLKELRLERGLTQIALSKLTGISQAGIAKWELGKRTPNMFCLMVLSKFFGVTTDYLLGLED